ncbi:MAG: type IV pili twitching motility protein PilT, partial [Nitrospiria bacterium]
IEGILSQQLITKMNRQGRVMAMEVLVPTPAIRNLIREDKVHLIYGAMQAGQEKSGMQTMNQSLYELYSKHQISHEEAIGRSSQPEELIAMMNRGGGPLPGVREPGRMVRR